MPVRRRARRVTNVSMLDVLRPGTREAEVTVKEEEPVVETKVEVAEPEPEKAVKGKRVTDENYVDKIRSLPTIQDVLQELVKQERILRIDKSVIRELEQYCSTKAVIPEILSTDNRPTVDKAHEGLYELQARLDRVAAVHIGVRRIQRSLQKLETTARHGLARHDYITPKTSKPSADQLLALALPELQNYQDAWETFSRICRDVQDHLGSAKEVIRIQMKLDENLHWAQRSGA